MGVEVDMVGVAEVSDIDPRNTVPDQSFWIRSMFVFVNFGLPLFGTAAGRSTRRWTVSIDARTTRMAASR